MDSIKVFQSRLEERNALNLYILMKIIWTTIGSFALIFIFFYVYKLGYSQAAYATLLGGGMCILPIAKHIIRRIKMKFLIDNEIEMMKFDSQG